MDVDETETGLKFPSLSARVVVKAFPEKECRMRDKLRRKQVDLGQVEFEIWVTFAESSSHGEAM